MIKAVIFDAGGVLHASDEAVSQDIKQELGLSDQQVHQIFSKYLALLGTRKITEQQVWDEVRQDFGIRQVSADEHLFSRRFKTTLQKMPGVYELIDELKGRGLKVALLTNVTPDFAQILEAEGHYAPFDLKVLSCEVGLWKPDPAIYQLALDGLGIEPSEAVFIDDLERNVKAAEALGIHGLVFRDVDQIKQDLNRLLG